jgi:DNA mismatch repair ATPase MutS
MSICEYILDVSSRSSSNFTFFTTHYKELTFLANIYPRVANYHFESKIIMKDDDENEQNHIKQIKHSYKLTKGVNKLKNYGNYFKTIDFLYF